MQKLMLAVAILFSVAGSQVHAGLLDAIDHASNGTSQEKSSTLSKLEDLKDLSTATDAKSLVTKLVDKKCRNDLNDRLEWKLLAITMSSSRQKKWQDNVCGCASEEAVNAATSTDLVKVANPSTRTETVTDMTTKAVTTCIKRFK